MGLIRRAIREDFIIVVISTGLTMDVESNAVMVSAIEESNPAYWQAGNPDFYIVFFQSKDIASRDRSGRLLANIKGLIMRDDRFSGFKSWHT